MFLFLLTALTYFYFHWQYFSLLTELRNREPRRLVIILLSFAVNYLFFVICSVWEIPLIINWFLFSFILLFETLFYNQWDKRCAYFSTWMGIIYGLSVNIFCRSVIAIGMNQPLQNFDNHIKSVGNLKGVPVLLGFLLAGFVFWNVRRPVLFGRLRLILAHPGHQFFLLEIMTGLLLYLYLNLLLYAAPSNNLLLKVWSIKSCIFSVVGLYIATRYTGRICELDDYREKNRQIEQQLEEQQQEEERLKLKTAHDPMTGLYNRYFAEEKMVSLMEKKDGFILCFLDLDGLKRVNDQYGHDEGDRYILTVTKEIQCVCQNSKDLAFRFGGDEFLLLFEELTIGKAVERVKLLNARLSSIKEEQGFLYPLSLSYGVVESAGDTDWRELIRAADQQMYRQKQEKKAARDL